MAGHRFCCGVARPQSDPRKRENWTVALNKLSFSKARLGAARHEKGPAVVKHAGSLARLRGSRIARLGYPENSRTNEMLQVTGAVRLPLAHETIRTPLHLVERLDEQEG